MKFRGSLAQRIVIAFVAMTVVVSGAFAVSIILVVHLLEARLVSQELSDELDRMSYAALGGGPLPYIEDQTYFYTSHPAGPPIPAGLQEIKNGFSELIDTEQSLYVFQVKKNEWRFVITKNQQGFEEREQVLFSVVLAGFLLSVLLAWGLGWLLARRVMAPVIRLSYQVRNREPAPLLQTDYAQDEVGELARAFDNALAKLHQALQRERFFTSDVSHEIRTPLMVIASSCELLTVSQSLDQNGRDQVARVQRACVELQELVQTFLTLARGDAGDTTTVGSKPLLDIAQAAMGRFSAEATEKGLVLKLQVEGSDDGLYNTSFLGTVISNLLRNALHYTDRGEVRLVLQRDGLRVEDDGIGISPQQKDLVFDAFFRGDRARGEGLGLGLSIVRRICAHQGWRIAAVERDIGSCFEVHLGSEVRA